MCTNTAARQDTSSDDDAWLDDGDVQEGAARHDDLERENNARQQHFWNVGYRDGIEEGKPTTLQQGFDIGFCEGGQAGFEWGVVKGAVKTMEVLCGQVAGTSGLRDKAAALASEVDLPARQAMLGLFKHVLSQPVPSDRLSGAEDQQGLLQALQRLQLQQQPGTSQGGAAEVSGGQDLSLPDMAALVSRVQQAVADMGFTLPHQHATSSSTADPSGASVGGGGATDGDSAGGAAVQIE